ncbi:MAG: ABC transporter ATP-binding protein, partial [Bdellovibrionota bacterium]
NPEILFLDEPTTGLDPGARRMFWDLVRTLRTQGKTLVLTTHYMEEAYALCDEIAIMNQGQIIAQGAPDRLLDQHFNETLVELPGTELKPGPGQPFRVECRQGSSTLFTSDVNSTMKWLLDHGYDLKGARMRPPSLEDLFLEVTRA